MLGFCMLVSQVQAGWFGPSTVQECEASISGLKIWLGARKVFVLSCSIHSVDGWNEKGMSDLSKNQRFLVEETATCLYEQGIRDGLNDEISFKKVMTQCSKDNFSYRYFNRHVKPK